MRGGGWEGGGLLINRCHLVFKSIIAMKILESRFGSSHLLKMEDEVQQDYPESAQKFGLQSIADSKGPACMVALRMLHAHI